MGSWKDFGGGIMGVEGDDGIWSVRCEACEAYEAYEACEACKWLIHPRIRRNIFTRGNSFECQMSESGSSVTEIGTLEGCKN